MSIHISDLVGEISALRREREELRHALCSSREEVRKMRSGRCVEHYCDPKHYGLNIQLGIFDGGHEIAISFNGGQVNLKTNPIGVVCGIDTYESSMDKGQCAQFLRELVDVLDGAFGSDVFCRTYDLGDIDMHPRVVI